MRFDSKAYDRAFPRKPKQPKMPEIDPDDSMVEEVKAVEEVKKPVEVLEDGDTGTGEPDTE